MTKWLPPIDPPADAKMNDVWRLYEQGRLLVLRVHGKQIGVKP